MSISKSQFDQIKTLVSKNPKISTRELSRECGISRDMADRWRKCDTFSPDRPVAAVTEQLPNIEEHRLKKENLRLRQQLTAALETRETDNALIQITEKLAACPVKTLEKSGVARSLIARVQDALHVVRTKRGQIGVGGTVRKIGKSHAIIPDCQVRPGVDISHLRHIGNYLAEKQPDVIVCIGDFADMPSLSSYTVGKADAEGQRYVDDIKSVRTAMDALLGPVREVRGYTPRMIFTLGNHEERITREVECNPKLIGKISIDDLGYEQDGWEVVPFLKPIKVDGIEYCHYFTSGAMGRPIASAAVLLRERQCSGVQGHVQFTDLAFHKKTGNFGLFCGICYTHDEKYLGFQGNTTRRQIVLLHEVKDGTADPMFVSLGFLKANYNY